MIAYLHLALLYFPNQLIALEYFFFFFFLNMLVVNTDQCHL